MRTPITLFTLSILAPIASGETLLVPNHYETIQSAIDASSHGDEVVVAPGVWHEQIDLKGRAITLRSSAGAAKTTLDGSLLGSIVTMTSGEGSDTILQGFTLANGWMTGTSCSALGGLMEITGSSPTIRACTFMDSSGAGTDGDISIQNGAAPIIENCTFPDGATVNVVCFASVDLDQCTFDGGEGNLLAHYGGRITCNQCQFSNIGSGESNGVGWAWWDAIIEFRGCSFQRINWEGTRRLFHSDTPSPAYGVFSDCHFRCHEIGDISGQWIDEGGNEFTSINGDANDDALVDVHDLLIVIAQWGVDTDLGDVTDDGRVDVSDILVVLSNWGDSC